MKVLLVDDEIPARARLRRLIEELEGDFEIAGEVGCCSAVVDQCAGGDVDVVLLDVQVPGLEGLAVAEELSRLEPPPAVVLVTQHPEFALEAFEHKVSDYLLKPVGRERLQHALARLPTTTRAQLRAGLKDTSASARAYLSAHYRGGVQKVAVDDILYLMAEQKYVTVCHRGGRMLVDESLKSLEREFSERFIRIHRNALVAVRRLSKLEKTPDGTCMAILDGCEERLQVSRRHMPKVRRFLRGS